MRKRLGTKSLLPLPPKIWGLRGEITKMIFEINETFKSHSLASSRFVKPSNIEIVRLVRAMRVLKQSNVEKRKKENTKSCNFTKSERHNP